MQRDAQLPNGGATFGGLAHDAAAGANLALTMLPKAMAYAVVAGVPPVYGLYASCAAPALAVAFGSNRLLFTGPVGVMTVLVLGSLHHFAHAFSPAYIELAASLTLMVGVLTLLFAAARLGFLVRAISAPVTEGFIAAAALLIIGTQVGPALGAPPPSARSGIHLPAFLAEAAEAWAGRDVLVLGLFAACIAIALLARRLFPRIPDALVVVGLAFAATFACGLSERGVEMVGALPTGLPPVSTPSLSPLLSGQLWASAALLALVGMTETSSISRFVSRQTGQRSDKRTNVI
jgi:SulP family sulfate permease